MTAHTCTTLTPGCYRCEINRDEIEAAQQEIRDEAEAAWLVYRNEHMRRAWGASGRDAHRVQRQLRKREFMAGYLAAHDLSP